MFAKNTTVDDLSAGRRQFRLRSLLAVVVLLAFPCAWYAAAIQEHRRQVATVASLSDLNVRIGWRTIGPRWLPDWEAFRRVDQVSVNAMSQHDRFTDDTVKRLIDLNQLTELSLDSANISDAAIPSLRELARLSDLDLSKTKITDAGIRELLALKQLQSLSLTFMGSAYGGQITDRGIAELATLPNLRVLSLMGTDAGDETVKALGTNPTLEFVDLRETQATSAAINKLRESKPQLTVLAE